MHNPIQGLTRPLSPQTKPNPQISKNCLEFRGEIKIRRLINCSRVIALNNIQGRKINSVVKKIILFVRKQFI